jgi:hypothetical protein
MALKNTPLAVFSGGAIVLRMIEAGFAVRLTS